MAETKPYVATQPLFVDGVRAHNPGDVVPDDNVKRNGWGDFVARQGSKAAEDATAPTEAQSVSAQAPPPK